MWSLHPFILLSRFLLKFNKRIIVGGELKVGVPSVSNVIPQTLHHFLFYSCKNVRRQNKVFKLSIQRIITTTSVDALMFYSAQNSFHYLLEFSCFVFYYVFCWPWSVFMIMLKNSVAIITCLNYTVCPFTDYET